MNKICKHFWLYEHAVYGGDKDKTSVHRQCQKCGLHQVGRVTKWEPMQIGPCKEFDDVPDLTEKEKV